MGKKRNRRVNKKRRANLGAVAFVVLLLCCMVAYKKVNLDLQEAECQKKIEQLDETKKKEEQRSKEIEEYKDYVKSKQYIEKEARDKLGLVYPDEIVFEADEN